MKIVNIKEAKRNKFGYTRDGNRSGRTADRVNGRVEILRPADQAVETPVKFFFLAIKRHLSTNRNILYILL